MGFDMQEQSELKNWISQTIQFALVSSGKDEVEEGEVKNILTEVYKSLSAPALYRSVISAVLERAVVLLGEEREVPNEEIDSSYVLPVMQWTLKTVAVVFVSKGKPFNHEQLEAVADHKIIAGVQGGKRSPRRDDLDKVVRKAILWGATELGINLVPAVGGT